MNDKIQPMTPIYRRVDIDGIIFDTLLYPSGDIAISQPQLLGHKIKSLDKSQILTFNEIEFWLKYYGFESPMNKINQLINLDQGIDVHAATIKAQLYDIVSEYGNGESHFLANCLIESLDKNKSLKITNESFEYMPCIKIWRFHYDFYVTSINSQFITAIEAQEYDEIQKKFRNGTLNLHDCNYRDIDFIELPMPSLKSIFFGDNSLSGFNIFELLKK